MTQAVEGFPPELAQVDLGRGAITLQVDASIYPLEALYGASYVFIDRAYVLLDRPAPDRFRVTLTAKKGATETFLRALAGEFANELLNQVMRRRVGESTAKIREYYMAKVFSGANRPATIEALLAELDEEELAEDPLSIAVPWEKPA